MNNTNDKTAKTQDTAAKKPEVTVTITEDLAISENAVARIQGIYDKFVKEHFEIGDPDDEALFHANIEDDLKQETAVAVLEALMCMPDDAVPSQAEIYEIVSKYLEQWLDAQNGSGEYISLQEIMSEMYSDDDEYQDVEPYCDHCRKHINIYNCDGGVINITL